MFDKDIPDRKPNQSIISNDHSQDTKPNDTEKKDSKKSESYIAGFQENNLFSPKQQNITIQVRDIDDVKNQSSFFSWLHQYTANANDLKEAGNDITDNFNSLSNYLSKVIGIVTTIFTVSVFALIASTFFLPHFSLVLIGICSLSCLVILIAVGFHLSQIHLYKTPEEDINLIEQKYIQGKIVAIFKELFDNENLNIEENINYTILAMHIKKTAESPETSNQYLKLHNSIEEVVSQSQNTEQLNDELIDENLKQITNLTINLLDFLFSNINTENEDQTVIDFLDRAKVSFINQCNDVHKIEKFYDLLYDVLLPNKELITDKNLENSVNDIKTKTINAINQGIQIFINDNPQE
jgi:hypothetical protein